MKKYRIYIVAVLAAALGLMVGWIVFEGAGVAHTDPTQYEKAPQMVDSEIWTCSMHPQIRQPESGDCPICGMDLIPASQSSNENEFGFQMTDEAIKLANIQTSLIGGYADKNNRGLQLNGKIQADETQSASLVTHIPGRIEKLYISYTGEQVRQGQKIATIYSPELITAQKELLEANNIQDISPGLLEAVRIKLQYWKINDEIIQDILSSGSIRETFDLYAAHAGVVHQKRVSVGDYLSTGEVLFDIQNLSTLWVLFDVYEKDLSQVQVGRSIRFSTPSAPNRVFKAIITFINPVIDSKTRAASIRAEVSNAGGKLKPEMFITGTLSTTQKSNHLSIPKSAVLWTGSRSVVYVRIPNTDIPTFEYREIDIAEASGDIYAVISGLDDGEEVVTNGAFVIDASSQLNNQASMMNKNVRAKNTLYTKVLPDYTDVVPMEFKKQLSDLASAYFPLKDALVESNSEQAMSASEHLLAVLEKVDMSLVKDEAHLYWMEQRSAIEAHSGNIKVQTDIEEQRRQFEFLSQGIINSLKVFGVESDTFYVQHCPMVNDNNGADWLSMQRNIRNPYFGDKMLTCGIVQDTIDQDFKNPSMPHLTSTQTILHNH